MRSAWDPQTASNIARWLNGTYDEETKEAVRRLIEKHPQEAVDAFYTHLSFGTGGMRGLMDVGTNRINKYTIRATTQALANYINKHPSPSQGHSAFIGFDSRHHSHAFAQEAAQVLAANGIRVFLCKEFRPTPLISFGCRLKNCTAGIMITASHNPPQYNGYKVYWNDGGQVLPHQSQDIMNEMAKISNEGIVKSVSSINDPMITIVSEEIDRLYIDEGTRLQNYPEDNRLYGKDLKIIYTSLHGTGITLAPKMLSSWGFSNIAYVDAQVIPDGSFPTVEFPNPENRSALEMGLEKLQTSNSDLLIANDPDGDRVGIAVMHQGKSVMLNGNQIACLCLEHLCRTLKSPLTAAFIKTIVTTELFQAICDHYKAKCFNVPTGFKYVAELISEWEKNSDAPQFIFAAEESCGYLYGTLTRDKDAIIPSALIAEIALQAKRQGKTLIDHLHELYQKHGVFIEEVISVNFEETKAGKESMAKKMTDLRSHPPKELDGIDVVSFEDYLKHRPSSDTLLFRLADDSKLIVRPSGTEPKIKLYCGVVGSSLDLIEESRKKASQLLLSLKSILQK